MCCASLPTIWKLISLQTAFCESGAPNAPNSGEEYLHLPAIVDAAESSPTAAKQAAATIRRYLSKEHNQRGFAQRNAIMLTRILTDNPAHAFTQYFDAKFVSTVKELLREGKDTGVQQILRETLDYFEVEKLPGNDTLNPLIEMWRKEKGKRNTLRYSVGWSSLEAVSTDHGTEHHQQQHRVPPAFTGSRQQSTRRRDVLPPPDELVSRIEEAKTTARLLVQTVQSTPQSELLANDLVREFGERAKTAQKSIQGFLNAQDPAPDPDTMLTLIETNDQLNIAMSKHQRSILQARKSTGLATPSPQNEISTNPLSAPQHSLGQNVYNAPMPSNQGPYSVSPPRQQQQQQQQIPSPVSPMRREEHFSPPPGPPPGAHGAVRTQPTHAPASSFDYTSAYAAPSGPPPSSGYTAPSGPPPTEEYNAPPGPPPVPDRARPLSQGFSEPPVVSTTAYGVSENPFADDAYGEDGQPARRSHALFDRNQNTPPPQPEQPRPGGYQPTPSYIQRQDSSAANITVHGASPPAETAGHDQRNSGYGSSAVSPVDDTQGAGKKMNDLRI